MLPLTLLELGGGAVAPADVRAALAQGAFDIEAPGVDGLAGFGLIDAAASGDASAAPEPLRAGSLGAGVALLAALSRSSLGRRARARQPL